MKPNLAAFTPDNDRSNHWISSSHECSRVEGSEHWLDRGFGSEALPDRVAVERGF